MAGPVAGVAQALGEGPGVADAGDEDGGAVAGGAVGQGVELGGDGVRAVLGDQPLGDGAGDSLGADAGNNRVVRGGRGGQ